MVKPESQIVPIYNSRSGNHIARELITKHLVDLEEAPLSPPVFPVLDVVDLEPNELIRSLEQAHYTYIPIYGGDGTHSSLLRLAFQLVKAGELNPDSLAFILMGHRGSGGERIMAKTLGTDGKSLKTIIEGVGSHNYSAESLQPKMITTDTGNQIPLWWLYGSSQGLLANILKQIEEYRAQEVKQHSVRLLKTIISIWQKFAFGNQAVEAQLRDETHMAHELAYLVPPFLALSRFQFHHSHEPILLLLDQGDCEKLEFYSQSLWSLLSLAILGQAKGKVLKAKSLKPTESVNITNHHSRNQQLLDSELTDQLSAQLVISQQKQTPALNVVKKTSQSR